MAESANALTSAPSVPVVPAAGQGSRTAPGAAGLHEIVVVGGGAAGLQLATQLGDKLGRRGKARVTLVDRSRTHIWKPLLHEVAAGSMDVGHHAVDYLAQAHRHHFGYRIGEMIALDREKKEVCVAASRDLEGAEVTPPRSFRYDTLVIAVGSRSNDFGTPGVAQHAISLDTPDEAERFHQRLVNACIRAHAQPGPVRPGQLHVTIIGAGATGTELAAELHRTAREVISHGLDRIDPERDFKLTLVEASDRILPALPARISENVHRSLQALGIDVRTKAKVTEVSGEGVRLVDGELIPSELVVWAAGVRGPDVLADLGGLEVTRSNQLVVTPMLQTTRDPNVFAIGDCAFLKYEGQERPVPPRAQAAHQQASHLVKQMRRRLEGKPLQPFVYKDFGSLVSLGHYTAIGNLMGFVGGKNLFIEGILARLMYRSLYQMHQRALHGAPKTALDTTARFLTRGTSPRVKLH